MYCFVGDAQAMSRATKAILKHYSSTVENPQHDDCPPGKDSWCSFQRDIVTGGNTWIPVKNPIPPAIQKVLQPTFDFLSSVELLQGCVNCYSQNQNESLHHVIWDKVPKDQFHSSNEVKLGVDMGILHFNCGQSMANRDLFENLHINLSEKSQGVFRELDRIRVQEAEVKSSESHKEKRKRRRKGKLAQLDAFQHDEGTTYASGQFHSKEQCTPMSKDTNRTVIPRKCKKCNKPMRGHKRALCN